MITAVLMFFATFIAIVIYIIYSFRYFALFLLFLLAFIIYLKVRKEIKKYGPNSIFRAFHPYPTENEQIKLVKQILKNKLKINFLFELDSKILIAVTTSGIYIIKVLDVLGRVIGDKEDDILLLKNEKTTTISNFFKELDFIEEEIKTQIKKVVMKKIIVKKGTCLIETSYGKEYLVVGMHNFYYEFQRLEKEKRYSLETINKIASCLSKCLSNSVKL